MRNADCPRGRATPFPEVNFATFQVGRNGIPSGRSATPSYNTTRIQTSLLPRVAVMSVFSGLFIAAVVGFTLAAAISDLKTRRLPNWLNVSALVAAIVVHTAMNGLTGLGFSLLGFATGFGILFVLWLIGGGGGGDVKLMGAVGAWLGAALTLKVFLLSAVLIAILCFAVLIGAFVRYGFSYVKERYLASGRSNDSSRRRDLKKQRQRYRVMPYAVPVALSTWLILAVAWRTSTLPL